MNCQSFGNVVVELARSQPMEASVRDAALAHVAGCDSCARRLADEKLLTGGLHALVSEMKAATAPDRLEQNLISAFRQQDFAPQLGRANNRWAYLAIAAGVIVTVALGIAGFRTRQTGPSDSQAHSLPPSEVHTPSNEATPSTKPSDSPRGKQKLRQAVVRKQRPAKARQVEFAHSTFVTVVVGSVTDPETPEVVSPYVPMGYTNPANMQEGAQVVRVELPRYAMARFGLPVNMERYDERVKADVWLGADGLARAIRFVQ